MSILDWFRPRWQSSDAEVRLQAVKAFAEGDERNLERVARRDRDPRVRRAAVKKIDDPTLLGELAGADTDEGVAKLAAERATRILVERAAGRGDPAVAQRALAALRSEKAVAEVARTAADDGVRRAALGRLTEVQSLLDVVRHANDPALRAAAVARIHDAATLRELALHDSHREVAAAALEHIHDNPTLAEIAEQARNKQVRKSARERLPRAASGGRSGVVLPPAPEALHHARKVQLCRELEQLLRSDDPEAIATRLEVVRGEWTEVGAADDDDALEERFARASTRAAERRTALITAREEAARQAEAEAREEAERAERRAREADERARRDAEAKERQAGDEASERAAAEERARRAEAEREARKAQGDAERSKRDEEERRVGAENLARMEEVIARIASITVDAKGWKAAEKAVKDATAVFLSIGPAPREQAADVRARFQAARDRVLGAVREVEEAEDWKRWANIGPLVDLCKQVEALRDRVRGGPPTGATPDAAETTGATADSSTTGAAATTGAAGAAPTSSTAVTGAAGMSGAESEAPPAAAESTATTGGASAPTTDPSRGAPLATAAEGAAAPSEGGVDRAGQLKRAAAELKALQAAWKTVGPAPRDKSAALWDRFKKASDEVYAVVHQQFAAADAERAENLRRKRELVGRMEALVGPVADAAAYTGNLDWKDVADRVKQLQAEWKAIGPVPKQEADAVWDRFRGAADKFFARRKSHFDQLDEERAANLKKKESLVSEAETVAASSDKEEAKKVVRSLQAEWKKVGHVSKERADELWKRFRAACDKVFEETRPPPEEAAGPEQANEVQSEWKPATVADLLKQAQAKAAKRPGHAGAPTTAPSANAPSNAAPTPDAPSSGAATPSTPTKDAAATAAPTGGAAAASTPTKDAAVTGSPTSGESSKSGAPTTGAAAPSSGAPSGGGASGGASSGGASSDGGESGGGASGGASTDGGGSEGGST